jgi:probable rRNA maturation factor
MDSDSSHTIEVAIECPVWRSIATDPRGIVRRGVSAALAEALPPGSASCEVSILLADDSRLRALNLAWRGKDKPTNVLSFPADARVENGHRLLGDIAIALETVLREAAAEGKPPADHLSHLIVHGTLHLLGFDHETAVEAERMEALEVSVLARLGIADPYRGEVAA